MPPSRLLPIFRRFDTFDPALSSSDRQKFDAAIPTVNARRSSRYFGLRKGVVAYMLLANHVALNARINGANEFERHCIFDIRFNNVNDILPAVHSIDTHPTNHVDFAMLHLSGGREGAIGRSVHETRSVTEPSLSRRTQTAGRQRS